MSRELLALGVAASWPIHGVLYCPQQRIHPNRLYEQGGCAAEFAIPPHVGFIARGQDNSWNPQSHIRKTAQDVESGHVVHLYIDNQTGWHAGAQGIEEFAPRSIGLGIE